MSTREYVTIALLVILDQATKAIAMAAKPNNLLFELSKNTGAGFGVLPGRNGLLLFIGIAVLVLIWRPLMNSTGRERTAFMALTAGIIGNSLDRIFHGGVTDFISISSFPIFNVADSLITVSILYFVAIGVRESFSSWHFRRMGKKATRETKLRKK